MSLLPRGGWSVIAAALAVHTLLCLAILAHSLAQLWLATAFIRRRAATPPPPPDEWPVVTVQLPVFNERHLVARLLRHAAALRYPAGRLEIQVLDDSTDATSDIVALELSGLRATGIDAVHMRRTTRDGYKAEALRRGLASARGEFVAVFDADFMPPADFLLRTVPWFADPHVGAVQSRWAHANRERSILTQVQALMLDGHFSLEQGGRAAAGCFINFNGSAGIWRAAAIRDSGGWRADTLTEDLDLSYRAQLRGWRLVYLDAVETPGDLPDDVRSFRTQQFRWMKGVAQNARLQLPRVTRAGLTPRVKLHACAQLLESSVFLAVLGLIVASFPIAFVVRNTPFETYVAINPTMAISGLALFAVYWVALRERSRAPGGIVAYAWHWVSFLLITTGLSLHNSAAVVSGFVNRGGEFRRTPKRDPAESLDWLPHDEYVLHGVDRMFAGEVTLWVYLAAGLWWGVVADAAHLLFFAAVAFVGLTWVIVAQIRWATRTGPVALLWNAIGAADRTRSGDGRG